MHSSKLDYLGAVAALQALCNEFVIQHQADIQFNAENVPSDLSKEISLCLFRVTQEALQNATKYSGTHQAAVSVKGTADGVELVVQDSGTGFDVDQAKRNRGLGLISMQERVHLIQGRLDIESRPGAGTKIRAVIPILEENRSQTDIASADGIGGSTRNGFE